MLDSQNVKGLHDINQEVSENIYDKTRKKYIKELSDCTNRNVIIYYSAWLQKKDLGSNFVSIDDNDKLAFMSTIQDMDRSKGLDLVLHTPGGDVAATESLIDYLCEMFDKDIRAIVPQIAMSGGTMLACSCKEIVMGKQSNLGPIDPQLGGISAQAILSEFKQAADEINHDRNRVPLWQVIIGKYSPTLINECQNAVDWSEEILKSSLKSNMFKDCNNCKNTIDTILKELSSHGITKSHSRHISLNKCKDMGLKIIDLEENQKFQDAVLNLHHISTISMLKTSAAKIIENSEGKGFYQNVIPKK